MSVYRTIGPLVLIFARKHRFEYKLEPPSLTIFFLSVENFKDVYK